MRVLPHIVSAWDDLLVTLVGSWLAQVGAHGRLKIEGTWVRPGLAQSLTFVLTVSTLLQDPHLSLAFDLVKLIPEGLIALLELLSGFLAT